MVEVVEHIPLALHQNLFENIFNLLPDTVLITTPNRDFNKFFNMPEGELRDDDHKFEFTQAEFMIFAEKHRPHGYTVSVRGIEYPNPARIVGQYKHEYAKFH